MAARRRSQAQTRLVLDQAANPAPVATDLAAQLKPYAEAAIATLGKAATEGDVDAAKKILDFLAAAAKEDQGSRGLDVLRKVAEIRRAGSA